jgi:hypothetical protein
MQPNGQLKFNNKGNFLYRLSSPNTGIHVKYQFRTRDNNNPNRDSEVSLSSNFIGYLFTKITLTIGTKIVEEINHPGIVMDTLYHTEELEFRNYSGELHGFIPDDSDTVSDSIGTRTGNIAGNDAATVIQSVNQDLNRNVKINNEFNNGYCRRKKLYNY